MRPHPSRWKTFVSFGVRNYRYFFAGALISNLGQWIQTIGQDWLVLTHLTDNSSAALGIVTALQFLAFPILAPFSGAFVDRFNRRKVLILTQFCLMLLAAGLWALVATDTVQLWHVYGFATVQGAVMAFDNPARQAFVSEVVEPRMLPNAVGLNSTSFNMARLIGPGVAGMLIAAVGVGPTLLINAISFVFMLAALFAIRTDELHPAPRAKGKGAVRAGIGYVIRRPDLIILLAIAFMLGTFGMNFQIFNATMSTTVYNAGPDGFGLLGTVMAVGTLGGALVAARRTKPSLRTIMYGLAGFTVSTFLLSIAPSYWLYAIFLVPAGFCALTVLTSCNASVQLGTAPQFRGRVMAVYMAIFVGGTPIGAPVVGWIGEQFGARASILVGPVATALTIVGVMTYLMVHDGVRLRFQKGHLEVWRTGKDG